MGTGPDCGFCGMNGESGASRPRAVQCESSQWVQGGGAALCWLPLAPERQPDRHGGGVGALARLVCVFAIIYQLRDLAEPGGAIAPG